MRKAPRVPVIVVLTLLLCWVGQTASAWAAGLDPAPAKLIFIPGVMGSTLTAADGTVIWGKFGEDVSLAFDRDQLAKATPLANASLWGVEQAVYGTFFAELSSPLNVAPNFELFSYDWRASNVVSARELNKLLCGQDDPSEPVVIVAHSMGGLVLMHWMRQFYGKPCGGTGPVVNIGRVAFAATPILGAPKSLRSLFFGETLFDNRVLNDWLAGPLNRDGITFDSLYELFPLSHAYEGEQLQGGLACDARVDQASANSLRYRIYYEDETGERSPVDIFSAKLLMTFPDVERKLAALAIANPEAFLEDKLARARKAICELARYEMPDELAGRVKYYVGTKTVENIITDTMAAVTMRRAKPPSGFMTMFVGEPISTYVFAGEPGPGDGTVPQNMAFPKGARPILIPAVDHLGILSSPTFATYLELDREEATLPVEVTVGGIELPAVEGISTYSDLWRANFIDVAQLATPEGQDIISEFASTTLTINPWLSEAAQRSVDGVLASANDVYVFAKSNPSAENWLFAASTEGLSDIRRGWALNNAAMALYDAGLVSESKLLFDALKDRVNGDEGAIVDGGLLATIYNNSGWANLRLEEFEAAKADLSMALQIDPNATNAAAGLSNIERQLQAPSVPIALIN